MKTIAILTALALASCGPIDPASPNPLDTPETLISRPESMGTFGPHSEFYH